MHEEIIGRWTIRAAAESDSDVLLAWRNADVQWYLNPRTVPQKDHTIWLSERLSRADPALWILDTSDGPGGTVRLDRVADGRTFTSIVVGPEFRGRGIGAALLEFLTKQAASRQTAELYATIHPENIASQALFASAGYELSGVASAGFRLYRKAISD